MLCMLNYKALAIISRTTAYAHLKIVSSMIKDVVIHNEVVGFATGTFARIGRTPGEPSIRISPVKSLPRQLDDSGRLRLQCRLPLPNRSDDASPNAVYGKSAALVDSARASAKGRRDCGRREQHV